MDFVDLEVLRRSGTARERRFAQACVAMHVFFLAGISTGLNCQAYADPDLI